MHLHEWSYWTSGDQERRACDCGDVEVLEGDGNWLDIDWWRENREVYRG